jgi:N-acetylmuramoyl-L-alanine amidase
MPSSGGLPARALAILAAGIALIGPGVHAANPPGGHQCNQSTFRIAIDVGHTKGASGATSARGRKEYDFNLQLANRVSTDLRDAGYAVTVVNVSGIGKEQLAARTEIANSVSPALVLSLHHDAAQPRYYDSWIYNGRQLVFSDRFHGFSIFVSRLNRQYAESMRFAEYLSAALLGKGFTFSKHHAENIEGERREWADERHGIYYYDSLYLLKNATAPTVLLEAGVIVNRIEELTVGSDAGKAAIAAAILEAVQVYCHQAPRAQLTP